MNAKPILNTILLSDNQNRSTEKKYNNTDDAYKSSLRVLAIKKKGARQRINRRQWISECAYYRAEARAFEAGRELNDWLEAEKDYIKMLVTVYFSVLEEDGGMTIANLQQLAKAIGVENPEKLIQKTELVRAIQYISQQRSCFQSEINRLCQDKDCKWRTECKKLIAEWMR
jgi:hypothetical protein